MHLLHFHRSSVAFYVGTDYSLDIEDCLDEFLSCAACRNDEIQGRKKEFCGQIADLQTRLEAALDVHASTALSQPVDRAAARRISFLHRVRELIGFKRRAVCKTTRVTLQLARSNWLWTKFAHEL